MLAAHVNSEENFTVKTEATLETGQTARESEVSQDVVLGRVQAVQGLVAQPALVQLAQHLQLVVRVQRLDTLLLYQHLHFVSITGDAHCKGKTDGEIFVFLRNKKIVLLPELIRRVGS